MRTPAIDPSILPRLALLLPVVFLLSTTSADPNLWGHVRFGGDIVAARALPQSDEYSFTSDREWVNHEWLAEVIFYGAYHFFGPPGLILVRLALLAAMLALVARTVHRSGVPPVIGDLLVVVAAAGTLATTGTVRPQLFSLVAFAWLLSQLSSVSPIPQSLNFAMLFALWANLHGGWLVGLGTLGVWTFVKLGNWGIGRLGNWERFGLLGTLVLSAAATAINPYGIGLWRFLVDTVGVTRADIVEWRPIVSAPPVELAVWGAMCAAAFASGVAAFTRGSRRFEIAAVVMLLAAGSFRVRRLDAFFALAVVMLAAPALVRHFVRGANSLARGANPSGSPGEPERLAPRPVPPGESERLAPQRLRSRAFVVLLAAVVASIGVLLDGSMRPSGRFGCIDATDPRLPDAQAGAFLRARLAEPGRSFQRERMLTWFDWGEYVIWHFAPRVQVSIDGRRETVYSDRVIAEHLDFYFRDPGSGIRNPNPDAQIPKSPDPQISPIPDPRSPIPDPRSPIPDFVARLNPDSIWLPADLPVVPALDAAGWQRAFTGQRSVIFQRRPPGPSSPPSPVLSSSCFPDS